ncbi:hypothetical protein HHK36_012909 [Tetracentron sinense]|uniref:Uncharacterized protein n=1 Tax=Tetracentron sinense TaxID=13715 RepID=A0A835DEZ1_TETSI|nr:hypothetical protein HHK36_012909 [Tetracentron sinense]
MLQLLHERGWKLWTTSRAPPAVSLALAVLRTFLKSVFSQYSTHTSSELIESLNAVESMVLLYHIPAQSLDAPGAMAQCDMSFDFLGGAMNFLLRTAQPVVPDQPAVHESSTDANSMAKRVTTLEGLIAEDPYPQYSTGEDGDRESDGVGGGSGSVAVPSAENDSPILEKHSDVTEDEGWITIPNKELPDNWSDAPDILSFRSLDRSFVFPGEQVHILACLSTSKQDTEIITPFRVAAVMSKNGIGQYTKQQNGNIGMHSNSVPGRGEVGPASQSVDQNGETLLTTEKTSLQGDISASESLLRMEDHKRRTETLLGKFQNSHFFVRIAESDVPLWSKRSAPEMSSESSEMNGEKFTASDAGARKTSRNDAHPNAVIDRGNFDASVSSGVARNTVKCCSLSNGDIVVLLQVNVGVEFLRDPILEVLQFEKHQDRNLASENLDSLVYANHEDPCGALLKWLFPLDRTLPPPARPLSPPPLNSSSAIGSASQKSTFSASSGSQLFSFGHFRSYSMSSLPQNIAPSPQPVATSNSKPIFDLEDWDRLSPQKFVKNKEAGTEGLLSFRGVSLEPERFSVHCGLEGIYIPGRRWRRKLEIIQPVEIHTFAADCNTDDLLCVQIKNVSPAHIPDIVIFVDAITIVFEEAPKGGPPLSLPIACIEAGNDHSLPNLALRRGEEHSFILKPATSMWKNPKIHNERSSQPSHSQPGIAASRLRLPSKTGEGKRRASTADQYAVLVSCRCNYTGIYTALITIILSEYFEEQIFNILILILCSLFTVESKLFFKQPTSWRPHITRDLMISVASEMSEQTLGPNGRISDLPVQVLTLQASNLTSEDLTLTVLAPASFTSPPSVVSLNSAPSTPMSPFVGLSEFSGRVGGERRSTGVQRLSSVPLVSENQKQSASSGARSLSLDEQTVSVSDVIPSTGLGCTHLWLQSTVPLGCVPSQSMATIKLELLPLTDGIITLDTLQIDVKEKDSEYQLEETILQKQSTMESPFACLPSPGTLQSSLCASHSLFSGEIRRAEGGFHGLMEEQGYPEVDQEVEIEDLLLK